MWTWDTIYFFYVRIARGLQYVLLNILMLYASFRNMVTKIYRSHKGQIQLIRVSHGDDCHAYVDFGPSVDMNITDDEAMMMMMIRGIFSYLDESIMTNTVETVRYRLHGRRLVLKKINSANDVVIYFDEALLIFGGFYVDGVGDSTKLSIRAVCRSMVEHAHDQTLTTVTLIKWW